VSLVFFRNGVKGEVDLVLIRLLGPFLCDIGSAHVDGFSFFQLPYLLDRFSLHEEDSFGYMQVATALELDWFP
jgi:hypothetical protein